MFNIIYILYESMEYLMFNIIYIYMNLWNIYLFSSQIASACFLRERGFFASVYFPMIIDSPNFCKTYKHVCQ